MICYIKWTSYVATLKNKDYVYLVYVKNLHKIIDLFIFTEKNI